jgi:hypothetical protein
MLTAEQLVAVARVHQAQLLALAVRHADQLRRLWARLAPVDDTALARWLDTAVPAAAAANVQAAYAAAAYIDLAVAAATDTPMVATSVDTVAAAAPRPTPPATVWTRPVIVVRTALARGADLATAQRLGADRVDQIARTDPPLAARAAAHSSMSAYPEVVGYRRVPDGDACPFCLLASTQRYHVRDLMPLHSRCGCTVAPIIGTVDPGHVIDRGLADRLMTDDPALGRRGAARQRARDLAAEGRAAADRVGITELGPTLITR